MKNHARVVVIGGGVMGVSLLYHLSKRGWDDIVLVEKNELTAGSTWHAAGLCTHFAHNPTIMEMRATSVRLYRDILPRETGQSTGFHPCGALRVTRSPERMDEFRQVQGLGQFLGYDFNLPTPRELQEIYPLCQTDGLLGAIHESYDGHVDPTLATNAMAAGARSRGARIYRHNEVLEISRARFGEWIVNTKNGDIRAEHIVNAAGTWCREIGTMMGIDLPVVPMLHQYLVTDSVAEVAERMAAGLAELPIIRDPEESWYLRQERDGLIIGPYEKNAPPWSVDGIPPEFGMELLPPDLDRIEHIVVQTMARMPALADAGIKTIVNGPITFTPDANPLLGPAFGLNNAWLLTGSSMGVMEGGGAGAFLADWMIEGAPPRDALAVDARRFGDYADRNYRLDKAIECFGLQFGIHYPFEERDAGRPRRVTPIYDRQAEAGAVFGCAYGWERPNWFSRGDAEAETKLTFGNPGWLDAVGVECRTVRDAVGIADLILDEEGLSLIEHNADLLLKEVGMEFRDDPEILGIFRAAGAAVDGVRVRFEPGMCRQIIQRSAPRRFKQHARNPDNTVVIGGDNTVLCPSWGPPFVSDLDAGRRYATLEDFRKLVKLHHAIPYLHHSGGVVCEPIDLPANKRHLDMLYTHIRYSDRPFMGAFIGAERAGDAIEMAKIVFGAAFMHENPVLYCVSNTNAPLVLDANMSGSLKTYARAKQPVACTPWTLAGAMSPCTVAGTMAQILAEALACLALVQLINPGAPCLMGSFASTMSMQSGAPTFGTPEAAKMVLASGQLARRLGVPLHTVGTLSASKAPDAQAEQEGTWSLLMAMFAGANVVNHATGWLEGGLVTSFEKTVIDADLCGKVASFFDGIDLSENAQALDAIREVGPGAHFLGSAHTRENFLDAFYRPSMSDSNAYEQWVAEGGLDAAKRANAEWKRLIEAYEDPGLDPAIDEALKDFINRRKTSMPDQDYF